MTTCASHELAKDDACSLIEAVSNALIDQLYNVPSTTHSGASMNELEALLPQKLPRKGNGGESFSAFIEEHFLPNLRNYRHPLHFGHQRPASYVAAAVADFAASLTNSTVSVFEAGPISVTLERLVLKWLRDIFDLPAYWAVTLTNGGTESTLTALLCARERNGQDSPITKQTIYASQHAHYSIKRSAHILGLRAENFTPISVNEKGEIDVDQLASQLENDVESGKTPIAICATVGTTGLSAFDDLSACNELARKYNTWLHVDACHGGAAALSLSLKQKIGGLAHADSFVWNPHKLMWVSPPCSCLFVREPSYLKKSLSPDLNDASYIVDNASKRISEANFQYKDDPLEWTLACTRQFSAFKIFAALYVYGLNTIADRIDKMCFLAKELFKKLSDNPLFECYCEPAFNIVCFRAILTDPDSTIHRDIRTKLALDTCTYLTGVEIDGKYWFRAHFISETTEVEDLDDLISLVSEHMQLPTAIHQTCGGNCHECRLEIQ